MKKKIKLTTSQALIRFLQSQYVRRDGKENPFFAGVWGIFGHGNVAGIGQALHEYPDMPYYLARNEQGMTHASIAYAKAKNRLQTFVCTSSIGPGATNMVTGAATATINRIPLLLLPGDIFARRNVGPVLQQLEHPYSQDLSVNDAFKPVSRYWDRINRPDQLPWALLEATRVLTSPAETGAVTLCMPQDVQAEAHYYSEALFEKRVWTIPRQQPDQHLYGNAMKLLKNAERPLIISGGGVLYSEATEALKEFVKVTGIPVCQTQAGMGVLPFDHPANLGGVGVSGTLAANKTAKEADVILALGTRLTDFTTSSKSQFQYADVKFIHVNVSAMDACKLSALPLHGDAKQTIEQLSTDLKDYFIPMEYASELDARKKEWNKELGKITHLSGEKLMQQPNVIRVVNETIGKNSTVVCAAGSMPADLHKLWKIQETGGYHMEYGYSCMGYEIAGGLGVKMANPDREVIVMVGDGSYQMLSSELISSIQERVKIIVVLLDNQGFGSIGSLSESVGSEGFGTNYRYRDSQSNRFEGGPLPLDLAMNAKSYGVGVQKVKSYNELEEALQLAQSADKTQVIVVPVDKEQKVPSYASWWDVQIAEYSTLESVNEARVKYEKERSKQRNFF